MDVALKLWTVIAIVGALNYLSRLSFIAVFSRRRMSPLLVRAFRYVPAAMLTALVLPMVITGQWAGAASMITPRAIAATAAGVVAFATRSMLKTLAVGMLTLWALQALAAQIG